MAAEASVVGLPVWLPGLGWPGRLVRLTAWAALMGAVVATTFASSIVVDVQTAGIYAIVGLSMNVLVGYAGQLSLGQQGLWGLGALVAANVAHTGGSTADPWRFGFCLAAAAVVTASAATILGLVALRIRGLYLALVTLIFGTTVADTLFAAPSLNGQGAGLAANKPTFADTDTTFALFVLVVVAACVYLDRRLTASKVGRSFVALREDERAAQAFGINVTGAKLLAFALSGLLVGVAGGLHAFQFNQFSQKDFTDVAGFNLALTFAVMAVVGGLGSRAGVLIASAFFGVLPSLLDWVFRQAGASTYYNDHKNYLPGLIAAVLLLQTVIMNPGGLGQVVSPLTSWLGGGPFRLAKDDLVLPGAGRAAVRA